MNDSDSSRSRYALISVSEKAGIVELARELVALGFSILSTGGTARLLKSEDVPVNNVSDHTGFPEIMDGRVKTLHPRIHGGILGRAVDGDVMQEHGIDPIDIVVVNLYPFEAVTSNPDCSLDDAIENIDIGGPAMVRAAAKNNARVSILTDPADYPVVLAELRDSGQVSDSTRLRLAASAYAHTARYDGIVADYLSRAAHGEAGELPIVHTPQFRQAQVMRYGENPHQLAAFYTPAGKSRTGLAAATQIQGKELSYNNIADADAALECVNQFAEGPACVIVKHANPCGAAVSGSLLEAYDKAYQTDPVSAFGGIISFNGEVDGPTAQAIIDRQFVEVVIAPSFDPAALEAFSGKANVRVLSFAGEADESRQLNYHRVAGGLLVQQNDNHIIGRQDCRSVADREPDEQEWTDMMFAWRMVRMIKSNAIVYAAGGQTMGIGAGQMSRVDSSRIAAWKADEAGLSLQGSAMASDAFFPFRDSIDAAAEKGIKTIIQPGGSMRDEEVIGAANEHGIAMVFTGVRHFRH